MLQKIKGPGIFLAQYMQDAEPFNSFASACKTMAGLGYKAVQIPTWDSRCIDLKLCAESQVYADELAGIAATYGLVISELSTHLQGQLVASHPAYQPLFAGFAPADLSSKPEAWPDWATNQLMLAAKASSRLGLRNHVTFSGALAWPYLYPWPQRPKGLVELAFEELGRRWLPILDTYKEAGIALCYELHPGEDLCDGHSYEMFLEQVGFHEAACINYDPSHFILQQLDYLAFIDLYHERIRAFHVKDAEFHPTGKAGVYGGFQNWIDRAGRFRSVGDGQVDFKGIFSKLTQYGYDGWAVVEWECCIKDALTGARESATHVNGYIIETARRAFDDFAGAESSKDEYKKILGL